MTPSCASQAGRRERRDPLVKCKNDKIYKEQKLRRATNRESNPQPWFDDMKVVKGAGQFFSGFPKSGVHFLG
jgi:hypothetical protein